MNKSIVLLEYMPGHYWDFFYDALELALKRGGLFIMAMQLKLYTPLSRKACLAGYRYKKKAVISEHHTHVGSSKVRHTLSGSLSRDTTLHAYYTGCYTVLFASSH